MFNTKTLIGMGLKLLSKFMAERGGQVEFTENEINEWLAQNGHAYSLITLSDPKKGKIIKIIYSGE